jgi:hypothetical protein
MCIPTTITKNKILLSGRGAVVATSDNSVSIWQHLDDPTSAWFTRTPAQRSSLALFISPNLELAGSGYVFLAADGFGVGVSNNRTSLFGTYYSTINPHIDLLRAFKKYLDYTKSISSNQFQNMFNSTQLEVIITGYSEGAVTAPGVANEFMPGVSQSMPATEASQFKINRILTGAGLSVNHIFNYMYTYRNDPTKILNSRLLNSTLANLSAIALASSDYLSSFATLNARANYLPSFQNDLNRSAGETFVGGNPDFNTSYQRIQYDYKTNKSLLQANGIIEPTGGFSDWKQLFDENSIYYFGQLIDNNIPWVSRLRHLKDLSNVPITNIYSLQDELCKPWGDFAPIDGAKALYENSNLGPDVVDASGLFRFAGANKTRTYTTVIGGDLAINPTSGTEAQMIFNTITQANNTFATYAVNATAFDNPNPLLSLARHANFFFVWNKYCIAILSQLN